MKMVDKLVSITNCGINMNYDAPFVPQDYERAVPSMVQDTSMPLGVHGPAGCLPADEPTHLFIHLLSIWMPALSINSWIIRELFDTAVVGQLLGCCISVRSIVLEKGWFGIQLSTRAKVEENMTFVLVSYRFNYIDPSLRIWQKICNKHYRLLKSLYILICGWRGSPAFYYIKRCDHFGGVWTNSSTTDKVLQITLLLLFAFPRDHSTPLNTAVGSNHYRWLISIRR